MSKIDDKIFFMIGIQDPKTKVIYYHTLSFNELIVSNNLTMDSPSGGKTNLIAKNFRTNVTRANVFRSECDITIYECNENGQPIDYASATLYKNRSVRFNFPNSRVVVICGVAPIEIIDELYEYSPQERAELIAKHNKINTETIAKISGVQISVVPEEHQPS